jgi:hypothetical protein
MPVFNNILAGSSGQGDTGYDINQSLRFGDGYLRKSFSTGTNPDKLTISCWVKPANLGATATTLFYGQSDANNFEKVVWNASGYLYWTGKVSGSTSFDCYTSMVFRDPASWYHLTLVYDSAQSTGSDRVNFYVNGVLQTKSTDTAPAQNLNSFLLSSSCTVGENESETNLFKSYMAECHAIDGQALTPASFGETNSATNQWIPVEYTGSYGTNGFYFPFSSTELANSFSDSSTDCGDGSPCYAGDTKLLLHFDGADDGTSFPDSSREGHSITRTGTVTKTGQKKFGTASAYFDGNDGLTTSDTSDFTFGTDPFTIECWVYVTSGAAFNTPSASDAGFLFCGDSSATSTRSVEFTIYRGELRAGLYNSDSSSATYISGGTINDTTWYHVALSRTASDAWAIYVDGSRVATSSTTKTLPQNANSGQIAIGARIEGGSLGQHFDGYIDDYRITKGVGRYSGASFTAPTAAFTNPTKSITANGDVANTRAQSKIGNSSIKFDGSGDYLSTASSGMGLTGDYTIECWFNTASSTNDNGIISNKYNNSSFNGNFSLRLNDGGNSNDIAFRPYNGTVAEGGLVTSGTGAWSDNTWTHVAVVRSGSGTGNVKMYINGSLAGTSSGASSSTILGNAGDLNIGRQESASAGTNYLNGYMDEIRISNSARYTGTFTPSTTAFTADANTLLLIHSDFNGGLGADNSGNKNDLDPTNLVVTDQVLDSPTNNFATLNPLVAGNFTFTEGNLIAVGPQGSTGASFSTLSVSSGKWYFECYFTDGEKWRMGVAPFNSTVGTETAIGTLIDLHDTGYIYNFTTGATAQTVGTLGSTGDVVGIALNMDDNEVTFYLNNSAYGSTASLGTPTAPYGAYCTNYSTSGDANPTYKFNFGADSSFAGSKTAQGNGGDGEDFYYTPPTGYKALNTDNLDDPAIALPTAHFNTVLYTGNGGNLTVDGVGFSADLTWLKNRVTARNHNLTDTVRGVNKYLSSDTSDDERTGAGVQSWTSDGFTLGSGVPSNDSGDNYASWNWKAGGTAVSNTDGTITSSVSANPTAGFSIAAYTGNGTSPSTIGHGLSVAPEMVMVKNRTTTGENWVVSVGNATGTNGDFLILNTTSAVIAGTSQFPSQPGSSTFAVTDAANVNTNTNNYIAYCFHSVEGYSKVGIYTGNGNADGVHLFTPGCLQPFNSCSHQAVATTGRSMTTSETHTT